MKTTPGKMIPDDFQLTDKTRAWCESKHPTLDIDGTMEQFVDFSKARGSLYACWQSAFKNYVRKSIQHGWDGAVFKQGRAQDPKWTPILSLAKPYGFRDPHSYETPTSYRQEFERWKEADKRSSPLVDFSSALRAIK